jgi:hypothetical protein
MPPVGFEPTISAGERPQTYALDRAVTGTFITSIALKLHYKCIRPFKCIGVTLFFVLDFHTHAGIPRLTILHILYTLKQTRTPPPTTRKNRNLPVLRFMPSQQPLIYCYNIIC